MFHLICEELAGDLLDGRIGHAEVEISKINFRDQLGSEEHLGVELDIHKNTKGAKDGVGPLLFQWGSRRVGPRVLPEIERVLAPRRRRGPWRRDSLGSFREVRFSLRKLEGVFLRLTRPAEKWRWSAQAVSESNQAKCRAHL